MCRRITKNLPRSDLHECDEQFGVLCAEQFGVLASLQNGLDAQMACGLFDAGGEKNAIYIHVGGSGMQSRGAGVEPEHEISVWCFFVVLRQFVSVHLAANWHFFGDQ